jgi:hypothetical protein
MAQKSYQITTISYFDKQLKRLVKKYPSLKNELLALIGELKTEPEKGTALGKGFFKIRLAIASKGTGKSGGARVITYNVSNEATVILASIYDKSEKSNIDNNELIQLLDYINNF